MVAFERKDPNGDLNSGKSHFFIADSFGGSVELSQEEARQAMEWLRSFLDPLPSLSDHRDAIGRALFEASVDADARTPQWEQLLNKEEWIRRAQKVLLANRQ